MLGERLKYLREKMGISQQTLADSLNTSRQVYNNYELNKREPNYDVIKQLSSFFNVSTDYLLGNTNDSSPVREKTDEEKTDEEILREIKFAFYGGMKKPLTKQDKKELVEMARLMGKLKREREENNDETSGNH